MSMAPEDHEILAMLNEPTAHHVQRQVSEHDASINRAIVALMPVLSGMFEQILKRIPFAKGTEIMNYQQKIANMIEPRQPSGGVNNDYSEGYAQARLDFAVIAAAADAEIRRLREALPIPTGIQKCPVIELWEDEKAQGDNPCPACGATVSGNDPVNGVCQALPR
jgi:hypothetical protein